MAVRKMIMGRKVGMTQLFDPDGKAVPVTVLEVGPCYVVQRRTAQRDGYEAVQIGYLEFDARDVKHAEELRREHDQRRKTNTRTSIDTDPRGKQRRLTLAALGHFTKHNVPPLRYLKEFTVAAPDDFAEGAVLRADLFAAGEKVDVAGISKGRGFAGVVKRYGFKGGRATHGSMFHRKPASGNATDPARIFPGSRRPGHMGNEAVTVKGLTVVRADAEKNMLVLKGAVPGANGSLIVVTLPERAVIERGKGKFVTFTALEKD
jgi:large subunit ribosomal protein L3